MLPPFEKINRTEHFPKIHARANCLLARTIRNLDHDQWSSSTSGSSTTTTSSPIAESPESHGVQSELPSHLAMPPPNPEAVRAARQKALDDKMPDVVTASRRLHNVLGFSNSIPGQSPLAPAISPQLRVRPKWMNNARRLVASLRTCKNFAVNMNRTSENLEFLDRRILSESDANGSAAIESRTKLTGPHSQSTSTKDAANVDHGIEDTVAFGAQKFGNTTKVGKVELNHDTSSPTEEMIATDLGGNKGPGITNTSAVVATSVSGKNESTVQTNKENPGLSKIWPKISVPDPMETPGTFTNALCHQQDFHVRPVLALTLREPTPPGQYSATPRGKILLHLEVGLDDVEALCQGTFTIDDSSYWKENLRKQQSLQKAAKAKEGIQAESQGKEQHQLEEGHGSEPWVFFGMRFQQTGEDKRTGKGGKWACFSVPMRSCSSNTGNNEAATFGGGCDCQGISVPQYSAKVQRLESRISKGGIARMDLWQNAGEWRGGVWSQVEQAMANNSLMVSSLHATEDSATAPMQRAGEAEANRPTA